VTHASVGEDKVRLVEVRRGREGTFAEDKE
jgi:hypothetical protein